MSQNLQLLSTDKIGIAQGRQLMFSDFEENGTMWSGEGPREVRIWVQFDLEFQRAPMVQVGVSLWDVDHMTNMRADLRAEGITKEGFDLVFRTWGDTRIARIRADWMAIGPMLDEELWEV